MQDDDNGALPCGRIKEKGGERMGKKAKNPKVGRPKIFESGKEFRAAIEKYFDSITYVETVKMPKIVTKTDGEGRQIPALDAKGHVLTELVTVETMSGKPAQKLCWTEAPSIEALQVFLGISKSTWSDYGKKEEFSEAVTYARGRVEAYLSTVGLENPKTARAAEFSLMHNFGWKNEQKVEVSGNVEDYLRKLDKEGRGQEM